MKEFRMVNLLFMAALVVALAGGCAGKKKSGDMSSSGDSGMDSASSGTGGDDSMMGGDSSTLSTTSSRLAAIYFEYDQANLDDSARTTLKSNFNVLKQDANMSIVIEGHCDSRGTDEYNLALGERRAKSIRDYLVNLGLPTKRVSTISYGEERPAVSGENESAWAQNRRGEFVVGSR
jgi:peptidoglycan-associated lipoprotein